MVRPKLKTRRGLVKKRSTRRKTTDSDTDSVFVPTRYRKKRGRSDSSYSCISVSSSDTNSEDTDSTETSSGRFHSSSVESSQSSDSRSSDSDEESVWSRYLKQKKKLNKKKTVGNGTRKPVTRNTRRNVPLTRRRNASEHSDDTESSLPRRKKLRSSARVNNSASSSISRPSRRLINRRPITISNGNSNSTSSSEHNSDEEFTVARRPDLDSNLNLKYIVEPPLIVHSHLSHLIPSFNNQSAQHHHYNVLFSKITRQHSAVSTGRSFSDSANRGRVSFGMERQVAASSSADNAADHRPFENMDLYHVSIESASWGQINIMRRNPSTPAEHQRFTIEEIANTSSSPSIDSDDVLSAPFKKKLRKKTDMLEETDCSSDGESEKCPICLFKFVSQLVGSPINCDHNFCSECIMKWAESSTTCPVDRLRFKTIVVRKMIGGKIIRKVHVEDRTLYVESTDLPVMETIHCTICHESQPEENMLLCDICDRGYHTYCLTPPLSAIPFGNWFCPDCDAQDSGPEGSSPVEIFDSDFESEPSRRTLRSTRSRRQRRGTSYSPPADILFQISAGVGSRRINRRNMYNINGSSRVRLNEEAVTDATTNPRRSGRRRNRTAGRRRRNRRANNLRACDRALASVRQIDQSLWERTRRSHALTTSLQFSVQPLDIFGSIEGFEPVSDPEDNDIGGEVSAISRVRSIFSVRRQRNVKAIANLINERSNIVNRRPIVLNQPSSANILDNILETQTLLHSKCSEIITKRDGTVKVILPKLLDDKPDLSNAEFTPNRIPLFPNSNENDSSGRVSRSFAGNSTASESQDTSAAGLASGSFNAFNPSTRPGFSNILENTASVDLSPFRTSAPIKFRMNPPVKPGSRKPPHMPVLPQVAPLKRPPTPPSFFEMVSSPNKENSPALDDDIDIYDDIETAPAAPLDFDKCFSSLEPPPEPPALLMACDGSSSDDDAGGLVIDDSRETSFGDNSKIYDPMEPNDSDDNDGLSHEKKLKNAVEPAYMYSPSYGEISDYGPHLPLPAPPAFPELPVELLGNSSDEGDNTQCPNISSYTYSTGRGTNEVKDIPFPDEQKLEYIPIPETLSNENIPLPVVSLLSPSTSNVSIPSPSNATRCASPEVTKSEDAAVAEAQRSSENISINDDTESDDSSDSDDDDSDESDDDDDDEDDSENSDNKNIPKHKSHVSKQPPSKLLDVTKHKSHHSERIHKHSRSPKPSRYNPRHFEQMRYKSRSPDSHQRDKSRSPDIHRRDKSRSPDIHRRDKSRSPDIHRCDKSRSPDIHRRDKSRSPDNHRRDKSRSPDNHRRDKSRSPDNHWRNKSRSPDNHHRDKSRSPDNHRRDKSRSLDIHRRDKSRSPNIYRRDIDRLPGRKMHYSEKERIRIRSNETVRKSLDNRTRARNINRNRRESEKKYNSVISDESTSESEKSVKKCEVGNMHNILEGMEIIDSCEGTDVSEEESENKCNDELHPKHNQEKASVTTVSEEDASQVSSGTKSELKGNSGNEIQVQRELGEIEQSIGINEEQLQADSSDGKEILKLGIENENNQEKKIPEEENVASHANDDEEENHDGDTVITKELFLEKIKSLATNGAHLESKIVDSVNDAIGLDEQNFSDIGANIFSTKEPVEIVSERISGSNASIAIDSGEKTDELISEKTGELDLNDLMTDDSKDDSGTHDKTIQYNSIDENDKSDGVSYSQEDVVELFQSKKFESLGINQASDFETSATSNFVLPGIEDLDPVSEAEYNDFHDERRAQKTIGKVVIKKKKKKKGKKKIVPENKKEKASDSNSEMPATTLEDGEILENKKRLKKKSRLLKHQKDNDNHQKPKKKSNKENVAGKVKVAKGSNKTSDNSWKKAKNTKDRHYRDGKEKHESDSKSKKEVEKVKKKEKRKELVLYDVRKIIDKPRKKVDKFGRDISVSRSRSYSPVRRASRSPPFNDAHDRGSRWTQPQWSPNWRRSRSRTRKSRSRSRNRNQHSKDRYRHKSKDRYIDHGELEIENQMSLHGKRKRSVSSEVPNNYPHKLKEMRKKKQRQREEISRSRSSSYIMISDDHRLRVAEDHMVRIPEEPMVRIGQDHIKRIRPELNRIPTERPPADYYYNQPWTSSSIPYGNMTPPEIRHYNRPYSCSLSPPIQIERLSVSPNLHTSQPHSNLTVIVPNKKVTASKKHSKKKENKKKKRRKTRQAPPSKEVFTSGDNILVSVNFSNRDNNASSKRPKRRVSEFPTNTNRNISNVDAVAAVARIKRKRSNLNVPQEVLNAKPVAVIDLNASPFKELNSSPIDVISLTDSGDEVTIHSTNGSLIDVTNSPEYDPSHEFRENSESPQHRNFNVTNFGPKTPELPLSFTISNTPQTRPIIAPNPLFMNDEINEDNDEPTNYNNANNTTPQSASEVRNSSPKVIYDPFEPTKSRSQSPEIQPTSDTNCQKNDFPAFVVDMFENDARSPANSVSPHSVTSTPICDNTTTDDVELSESHVAIDVTTILNKSNEFVSNSNDTNQGLTDNMDSECVDLCDEERVIPAGSNIVKPSQGLSSGKSPDKQTLDEQGSQSLKQTQSNSAIITPTKPLQSQQSTPNKNHGGVTPLKQIQTKLPNSLKQPIYPDILPWKLPKNSQITTPTLPALPVYTPAMTLNAIKTVKNLPLPMPPQNGSQDDCFYDFDDSPYSPASSEGDDLFEPPPTSVGTKTSKLPIPSVRENVKPKKSAFDSLFGSSPPSATKRCKGGLPKYSPTKQMPSKFPKYRSKPRTRKEVVGVKADEDQLKILDDVPNSAVELIVKEKFLKKLHRQERVVEEVKVVLKPHYAKKHITKDEYKDILRKAVPKICHNKSGAINPLKIHSLVEAYVKNIRYKKKEFSFNNNSNNNDVIAPILPGIINSKTLKKTKSAWA